MNYNTNMLVKGSFMELGNRYRGLLVVSLLALAACNGGPPDGKANNGKDKEEEIAVPVAVADATRGTVHAAYNGTTLLESDREADIVAKTSGVVLELLVEEGDAVDANQVVARLDRDRARIELNRVRANLNRLESEYRRSRELFEKKLISSEAFERIRSELEQEKANFEMAELELSYTDVRSPIAGVISERQVKVGTLVNLHDPLFRVHDFDPLLAVIHVPERELSALRAGQRAELLVDAMDGEQFVGELARISPVVDPETGTFKVTVEMHDPDPRLKPGMFGRVNIVYDVRENVVTIPAEALVVEDKNQYVYRVTDDRAQRVDVTTGYQTAGQIEIISGLEAGERVVTDGKGSIAADTLLDVINGAPTSEAIADGQAQLAGQAGADTAGG